MQCPFCNLLNADIGLYAFYCCFWQHSDHEYSISCFQRLIKPHCSCTISGFIELWDWSIRILIIRFSVWITKFIYQWPMFLSAAGFFVRVGEIDILRSYGILPQLYFIFNTSITLLIPNSFKTISISITISSGPTALFLSIFSNAVPIYFYFLFCSSIILCGVGFSPLVSGVL